MTAKNSTDWLRTEYVSRRQKNSRYTLRAFAKHLQMPSGRLSELLSGKRKLTLELANKFADRMAYSTEQRLVLFESVVRERKKPQGEKTNKNTQGYHELTDEILSFITEWYHFAILNLMKTKDFVGEPKWIAKRLGISVVEVRMAVQRMERLSILSQKDGKWVRHHDNLVTSYEIPSKALRESHRQMISKALESLEGVRLDKRDITSITFPADVKKLKKAKTLIKEFERKIAMLMESGEKEEVYQMNVQLFPLSKR